MKYILSFSLFFALSFTSYTQSLSTDSVYKLQGVKSDASSYSKISGSPFLFDNFKNSKVYFNNVSEPVVYMLNYNAYQDQMEFLKNDNQYKIANADQLKKIIIDDLIFVYKDFHNFKTIDHGYFIELIDDYISLYKRELKTVVESSNVAYNSESNSIGSFNKTTTLYYISIYGDPLIYIKNKRQLLRLFFNNPSLIDYIKKEKIKLNSEEDLKKVVQFLNNIDKNR